MRGWFSRAVQILRGCVLGDIEARLLAGLNAHDEMLDECTDRLANLEARMGEFDIKGKRTKRAA